jgi:hypothetical protein
MGPGKFAAVCAAILLAGACAGPAPAGQGPAIQIKDPWVMAYGGMVPPGPGTPTPEPTRPSDVMHMAPMDTALFMVIHNSGSQADRLIAASSDVATTVELHSGAMQGNKMVMDQVSAIDVPAGADTQLKLGGFHVMLIGLKRDLKVGDMVDVTLQFAKAGSVTIEAPVRVGG